MHQLPAHPLPARAQDGAHAARQLQQLLLVLWARGGLSGGTPKLRLEGREVSLAKQRRQWGDRDPERRT